jgi:hypothetical protein
VALGQVFSEYFGFPCQSSFHLLLHNHHLLSSGAGTMGQQWPTYQVDSVSPHPEKLKKIIFFCLFVVVSLLSRVVGFLYGVHQCVFLFCAGFFLWSYVDVPVMCRPMGMWCVVFMLFSSRGLPLCEECDACTT